MKHQPKAQFSKDDPGGGLTILQAIEQAKDAVGTMTGLSVDSVVHCSRGDDLNWAISVDVVESFARMGDNDLLATYAVTVTPGGEMQSFSRTRRYHREDRDG